MGRKKKSDSEAVETTAEVVPPTTTSDPPPIETTTTVEPAVPPPAPEQPAEQPAPTIVVNARRPQFLAQLLDRGTRPAKPIIVVDDYAEKALKKILEARRESAVAKTRLLIAMEGVKDLKAAYKAARDKLDTVVEKYDTDTKPLPLFDQGKKPVATTGQSSSNPTTTPTGADAIADPNSWRNCSIEELGLTPTLAEKLRENDIETIGQLEDKRASRDGLRGIKGIGQKKVDLIEDAVVGWLSKNRDAAALAAAAVPSAPVVVAADAETPVAADTPVAETPTTSDETPTASKTTTVVADATDAASSATVATATTSGGDAADEVATEATAGSFDDI